MSPQRLLIVHPDPSTRALLDSMLKSLGHQIDEAPNERTALRMLENQPADLVLTSVASQASKVESDSDAIEFLTYLRRKYRNTPVLMLCKEVDPDRRREAAIYGVKSVLRFPMPAMQLRAAVTQALGTVPQRPGYPDGDGRSNSKRNQQFAGAAGGRDGQASAATNESDTMAEELIGQCPVLVQTLEAAQGIAATPAPVLILGEHGTGKSLLGRHIHRLSSRGQGPFVAVDCATLSESALEVELFGQRGLTPDQGDRPGKVAQADGGTLYLDEVAALSPSLQFKLLRVIRFGEYEPVGSTETAKVDCRIMASSQEPLDPLVESNRFRADLFYALSVATLKLSPLRDRGGHDILLLAEAFRDRFAYQSGKQVNSFNDDASRALQQYGWPGNVQELRAVVERAVLLCQGHRIEPSHLSFASSERTRSTRITEPRRRDVNPRSILPLKEAMEGPEKQLILEALQAFNWNRQETARMLDINRTTLYKKMKKYGLLYDEPVWTN